MNTLFFLFRHKYPLLFIQSHFVRCLVNYIMSVSDWHQRQRQDSDTDSDCGSTSDATSHNTGSASVEDFGSGFFMTAASSFPEEVMQPITPPGLDVIDLTILDREEEDEELGDVADDHKTGCVAKFTLYKQMRVWKLKKMRPPLAHHIHFSCFSSSSKRHYNELQNCAKRTYVGTSTNPFVGNALFAAEDINEGEFITLYEGIRMSHKECDARQKKGRSPDYALYITKGVVVDALGFTYGAGMANHSCSPNTRLRHGYLRGRDRAPYGYLQAITDITMGTELEASYGYLPHLTPEQVRKIIRGGRYVPCHCLKPNCLKLLHTLQ